jgi:hypothetical protein
MPKGFAVVAAVVKYRGFLLELNHVDDNGEEENICYELIEIPRLNNSTLESKYISIIVWHLLENQYREEGINQVFVLTKDGNESLFRYQAKEADDEPMTKVEPPTAENYDLFFEQLRKKIKEIHGTEKIDYLRNRLRVKSLKEYLNSGN